MGKNNFIDYLFSLRQELTELINQQHYKGAIDKIHNQLIEAEKRKEREKYFLQADLAGFLIDIGEEGKIEKAAIEGLNILKRGEKQIKKYVWDDSYFYNIGNAYDTLYKIKLSTNQIEFKPDSIGLLNMARDSFWKAYKITRDNPENQLRPDYTVNLANSLDKSGRVVEALQFYDIVIKDNPGFPKAHANRSEALLWLTEVSGSSSVNLIHQAKEGYSMASESSDIPNWMKTIFEKKAEILEKKLQAHPNFKKFDLEHESKELKKEYESHSDYRKFCLREFLTLSEHSLYCNCIGARRDDLMIATPSFPIQGELIPVMEHYLNRIKSEFAISRLLLYRSLLGESEDWKIFQEEVVYTELFENEVIDIRTEMLRSSFRLCFGILDKIGEAICELYDLASSNENIYFENFWNPRGRNLSQKQKERWKKINSIQNPSLLALYSQACDLNSKKGEWSFFKSWRNSLEHGIFVISVDGTEGMDPFKIWDKKRKVASTDYLNFIEKTLELLRFTRSAIFNFVFCVRREGGKNLDGDNNPKITLKHK